MLTNDGPTPAGGVRSEAYLTDAAGAPTDDPKAAVAVEIVEFDAAGDELARTYGRTDYPAVPQATSEDDDNLDAVKATWDVTIVEDGMHRLVTTLAELSSVLDRDALGELGFRRAVASMMTLPVWDGMPADLQSEIREYLESTRPNSR